MAAAFISGTFNAFAFADAGFLFQKVNRGDYEAEMKRHNHALEELTKARDAWNEAKLKEIDRVQNLRYNKQESLKDIASTNKDLQEDHTRFSKTEPFLSQFYKPSNEMKGYMNLVKFIATVPVVYGAATFLI